MPISTEWIFDRPGIAIPAHVGLVLFAASGIAQPTRASSLDNVQVQFLLPPPVPMGAIETGPETGKAGLADAERAVRSLQPAGTVHRVFAVSEPNSSATVKLVWDTPAVPKTASLRPALPLEPDTGAESGMEDEAGLVTLAAPDEQTPQPTATVFRITVAPEPAAELGTASLAQSRKTATRPAPGGPNRLGAAIATASPHTAPDRGELLLDTLADADDEAGLVTPAAPGDVGQSTHFAATIKQAGKVSGTSRFEAQQQPLSMPGDELKSMMRAVVASRDRPENPLATDVYRAERSSASRNRLADSRAAGRTAYSGRSMSDETEISRYHRTGSGIQFEVPAKINGTVAGNVPLLIADGENISVKLGGLLSLIEPMMDKSEFASLSAAQAAGEFVTLNDLRAAGINVSFDKHDRLVLRAS